MPAAAGGAHRRTAPPSRKNHEGRIGIATTDIERGREEGSPGREAPDPANYTLPTIEMEAIGDIDVPRRAEFIRVIVDEMSRCASHLVWLGTYGLDLGATTPVLWCFRDREEILDMLEELCGSRMNFNYYRPGGVLYDLPP